MKQRISVRALIKKDGKTLLLRRSSGRPSILGKFELPGNRVAYKEQPEDTLRRCLRNDAGLDVKTMQLFDAITYIDQDDRDIQYIVIVYLVGLVDQDKELKLEQKYNKYLWTKMSNIQQESITDLTQLLLGIIKQDSLTDSMMHQNDDKDVKATSDKIIIYSDGGSRGNPGPSASGFAIMDNNETIIETGGVYIGITTNNQAEYQAVYQALKRAHELGLKVIDFRSDSSLVVNQLNGIYKIKNRDLWPIHEEIMDLIKQFDQVRFSHVRREFNQVADGVVNKILNDRSHTL